MGYIDDSYDEDDDYYGDENEEDEGDWEEGGGFVAEDQLLNLLVQVRRQLMNGDYRTLYTVWEKYGGFDSDENEFIIPVPQDKETGKNVVIEFRNILD